MEVVATINGVNYVIFNMPVYSDARYQYEKLNHWLTEHNGIKRGVKTMKRNGTNLMGVLEVLVPENYAVEFSSIDFIEKPDYTNPILNFGRFLSGR